MPQFPACDKNKVGECDMLQPAESVIRELDGQIIVVVGGGWRLERHIGWAG